MTKVTDDREGIKSYLDSSFCSSDENPWIYWGIECAFSMFESSDDSTGKIIVVLSDGELDSTQNKESVISDAKDNNVKIYTVGLGENAELHDKYLKPLSEKTGGSFYHISNVENITEIYNDVNKNEDIETDSDGDGIPDYYEDNLPMFNGITLHLDKIILTVMMTDLTTVKRLS